MKQISRLLIFALAAVLLLTACGDKKDPYKKGNKNDIDYEDYITPVVDRKVTDCITDEQVSAIVGFPMRPVGSQSDSVVNYQSDDAATMITLTLENKTRAEFEAIVAESAVVWVMQAGLGEVAYWSDNKTELIAYQDGYAASVAAYGVEDMAMYSVMEQLLSGLQ